MTGHTEKDEWQGWEWHICPNLRVVTFFLMVLINTHLVYLTCSFVRLCKFSGGIHAVEENDLY